MPQSIIHQSLNKKQASANQQRVFRWVIIWANFVEPFTVPQIFMTHSSLPLVLILIICTPYIDYFKLITLSLFFNWIYSEWTNATRIFGTKVKMPLFHVRFFSRSCHAICLLSNKFSKENFDCESRIDSQSLPKLPLILREILIFHQRF